MKKLIYIFSLLILSYNLLLCQDTTKAEPKKFQMQKSPTGAIIRSLILPGWGQYYVESYWKAPLFLGAAGTCAYFIIDNNSKFNSKQKEIDNLISIDPTNYKINYLKRQREVYRDNRDQAAFFLAGVYLLAAIDSYVGAHLFDFNVDDNVSVNLAPTNNSVSLFLNIKF